MRSEKDNIPEFNQYMKPEKMSSIIYPDIESLIKKIDGCKNNSENSLITKIGKHISCGNSLSTVWSFYHIENKHTHGKDCMKRSGSSLREHARNLIDFEENYTVSKIRTEITSRCKSLLCLCKKKSPKSSLKVKNIGKLEIIVAIHVNIEVQHIVYVI